MGKLKAALSKLINFDKQGRELPDPTPVDIPAGFKRPETLAEQIKRMIRTDMSSFAESQGAESFEEANDFEVDEDDAEQHPTHHELHEEVVDEVKRVKTEAAKRRAAHGSEESESGEDGVQEEADTPPKSGNNVSRRSGASQPRSAQRRPTGRREHAEDPPEREVSSGRGRPNRSYPRDEVED